MSDVIRPGIRPIHSIFLFFGCLLRVFVLYRVWADPIFKGLNPLKTAVISQRLYLLMCVICQTKGSDKIEKTLDFQRFFVI